MMEEVVNLFLLILHLEAEADVVLLEVQALEVTD